VFNTSNPTFSISFFPTKKNLPIVSMCDSPSLVIIFSIVPLVWCCSKGALPSLGLLGFGWVGFVGLVFDYLMLFSLSSVLVFLWMVS
jgi:hypothetical protein